MPVSEAPSRNAARHAAFEFASLALAKETKMGSFLPDVQAVGGQDAAFAGKKKRRRRRRSIWPQQQQQRAAAARRGRTAEAGARGGGTIVGRGVGRLVKALCSGSAKHEAVWVVLPFPRQEVIILRGQDLAEMVTMQTNPYRTPDTRGSYPTVGMVTHFYNEEMLLPYFIRHHAGIFDEVIMIDWGSTDRSRAIIADQAPSTQTTRD